MNRRGKEVGTVPMSDRKMARLALEAQELAAEAARLQAEAREKKQQVQDEMVRRGLRAVEGNGVRVTLVEPEGVTWDVQKLESKIPAKLWKDLHTPVLDWEKVSEAVSEGRLRPNIVDACTEVEAKTPYIRITARGNA